MSRCFFACSAAIALATSLSAAAPAQAEDCLLDRNGDGEVTVDPADNDGGADSGDSNSAVACGVGAVAAPGGSAIGYGATAASAAAAIGRDARAFGGSSVAIGASAQADQTGNIALGASALASGERSHAFGYRAVAEGLNAVAIGGDSNDTDSLGARASGADSTSIGTDATANGAGATALGSGAAALADRAVALGFGAAATGTGSLALGTGSIAAQANSVSFGNENLKRQLKNVAPGFSDDDAVTVGQLNNVRTQAAKAEVLSRYIRVNSTAPAPAATATGAIALGGYAIASGVDSIAIGSNGDGQAGTRITAAQAAGATAVGGQSRANRDHASAFGYRANAGELHSIAIGSFASANFANSLALGYQSAALRADQMMLGTINYSYTMPGLPTAASNAAQSGPLYYVTVDENGNLGYVPTAIGATPVGTASAMQEAAPVVVAELGEDNSYPEAPSPRPRAIGTRQANRSASSSLGIASAPAIAAVSDARFSALSGRVSAIEKRLDRFDLRMEGLEGGIAGAMALGSAVIVPDSTFSLSFNAATYGGEQGFAGSLIGRVADKAYVTAGVAGNTGDERVGGQVGVAFGF